MTPKLGRYFWKLFLVNGALMAIILAACVWVMMTQFDRFQDDALSRHLAAEAAALEVAVRDRFDRSRADELDALARQVGSTEREGVRVTFVLADGVVLGDSEADPATMESHADRPEIRRALRTGSGESVRWSHTVARNMKYVAVRVGSAADPRGVVRVSMAVQNIAARAEPMRRLTRTIAVVSGLAAVGLALALALLWSRRIRRITEAARSISRGDLSARVAVIGHDEVAVLGRSLNEMREKISTQLGTIDRQRRTLDALLSQLREGVVVADHDGRIVLINSEAVALLQLTSGQPGESFVGRTVEQCLPQRTLHDMLRAAPPTHRAATVRERSSPPPLAADFSPRGRPRGLKSEAHPDTEEVELRIPTTTGVKSILARAFDVRLPDAAGKKVDLDASELVGRAVVLTDITELTRVMQVKADLAANASHELRTPLSAIRAAVDTLRSIEATKDPAAASQCVDVIDRHSRRMEAMIGDLLELSQLESEKGRFAASRVSAETLFNDLTSTFAEETASKNVTWNTSVPDDDITLTVSPELLRMVLHNLIDNAVRFTGPGGCITVSASRNDHGVRFEVADTGCGIPKQDQARVFERFYQVQRARSGRNRGTGLGLSIVKHAAAAMGAELELLSSPDHGTTITVAIPS